MTRIGLFHDIHQPDEQSSYNGPQGSITTAIDQLGGTIGVEDIIINGDQVHPTDLDQSRVPHVEKEAFVKFWEYIDAATHSDKVLPCAIPNHHSVPIQQALEVDDRQTLGPYKKEYDDGLRVLVVRTSGPGTVTGSPGGTGPGGLGVSMGHVPARQVRWLDEEIQDAKAAGDAVLVVSHHALFFQSDSSSQAYAPRDVMVDSQQTSSLPYQVVRNYKDVHDVLSQYGNVVAYHGHTINQYRSSRTVDGVTYCHPGHWYKPGNDQIEGDYCYVDGDSTGITVTAVRQNDTTNTGTVADVTF